MVQNVQLLCFWTLSIVLCLSKKSPVYFSKHNVSETGYCLRLQVKLTHLGPIDRASPYLQCLKRCVLKNKQDGFLDKHRTMDNVQKHNSCKNVAGMHCTWSWHKCA
jgi:hypothetical protein